MPYARPTLTQLRAQALQDIAAGSLGPVSAFLRFQILPVLAWTISGIAYEHYGYQDWIARQAVPFTATDEYLEGWAALRGITRKPATPARLTIGFAGATPATALPAGTVIAAGGTGLAGSVPASGLSYTTDSVATVAADGSLSVSITSSTPGSAANLPVGAPIIIASPVQGIPALGSVTAIVSAGADQETDDALRTRMLLAYQSTAGNGSATDYVNWALAVPGVTRAWVARNGLGVPSVLLYVMLDDAEAAQGGFPQGTNGTAAGETRASVAAGDQLAVANAIWPEQSVEALVWVAAPARQVINFALANAAPNTAASVAAVEAQLQSLFLEVGTALGSTIYENQWTAALNAAGLTSYTVTAPVGPIVVPPGSLPVLGTVTLTS